MYRWEGLWGCEHAALPCGSEYLVQVVLGHLSYPSPIPLISFPLAGSLVNICSVKLSSFHFISSYKCIIYLTPLSCYLKQEQSTAYCKLWGAISFFALVLQHPCDAFTVFLVRETGRFEFNDAHCIIESVQMKTEKECIKVVWHESFVLQAQFLLPSLLLQLIVITFFFVSNKTFSGV